jgi:hypothetical protein
MDCSNKSSCTSEISTQKLIEDGLSPSDYKEDYSEKKNSLSSLSSSSEKKYRCNKCDSTFVNKQTLEVHQKTSSRCSNKSSDSESTDISKMCQFCDKGFASKQMRLYHETKCKEKIIFDLKKTHEDEVKSMKDEISSLRIELESVKNKYSSK